MSVIACIHLDLGKSIADILRDPAAQTILIWGLKIIAFLGAFAPLIGVLWALKGLPFVLQWAGFIFVGVLYCGLWPYWNDLLKKLRKL